MKDSKETSAVSQASRACKSKGNSPIGKDRQQRQSHKMDGSIGMQDKAQVQVNGYHMADSDGRGNY